MRELSDQEKALIASALMSKALLYKRLAKETPNSHLRSIYNNEAEKTISLGEEFYVELPLSQPRMQAAE